MRQRNSATSRMGTLIFCLLAAIGNSGSVQAVYLVTKSRAVINSKPSILAATLAVKATEVALCEGINDLLPVTFSFPVSGNVNVTLDPEIFEVTLLNLNEDSAPVTVTPKCATLAPAAEADERRLVLLLGAFSPEVGVGPVQVKVVGDLSLTLPDGVDASVQGLSFRAPPMLPDDFLGNSNGPQVIDYELVEPNTNVTADANGCGAAFPDATDVVRLIFASGLRERNLTDTAGDTPLDNLGTAASEERANAMFTVATSVSGLIQGFHGYGSSHKESSKVKLLGIADVDADNYVDLCISLTESAPKRLYVNMRCGAKYNFLSSKSTDDETEEDLDFGTVFGPAGNPCSTQLVVVKSKYKGNAYA